MVFGQLIPLIILEIKQKRFFVPYRPVYKNIHHQVSSRVIVNAVHKAMMPCPAKEKKHSDLPGDQIDEISIKFMKNLESDDAEKDDEM